MRIEPDALARNRRDRRRREADAGTGRPSSGCRSVCAGTADPAGLSEDEALERFGHAPLPPYIRREDGPDDRERYQTVYAREPGSVAAPTAGLHFTPELLSNASPRAASSAPSSCSTSVPGPSARSRSRTCGITGWTPSACRSPDETAAAVERARREGRRVVAVGTTVTRALESALDASGRLQPGERETDLVIVPGHRFRVVNALVTNFHLPGSSLLLLACAFAGRERLLAAYREAVPGATASTPTATRC